MSKRKSFYNPDYAIHPGEYLEEILEARQIKKKDLADRCGRSEKQISQIIGKHNTISSSTALAFEKALDVSADIWNNLNANYLLFQAKAKAKEAIEKNIKWITQFPVKELIKSGYLSQTENIIELTDELLHFYGISNIDVWDEYYQQKVVNYRKSAAFKENYFATLTWLRMGEIEAQKIETKPFNKQAFEDALKIIRSLTVENPKSFEPKMRQLCSASGIALVFVPELKQTHICGAAEWLAKDRAMIVMSLRYKTNDHFWFSFFHEAGHILLHGKKDVFIDFSKNDKDDLEKEADKFACEFLIPIKEYDRFIQRNRFFKTDIVAFAKEQHVAPGILVGRLQHDRKIPHNFHNKLKSHFELIYISKEKMNEQ